MGRAAVGLPNRAGLLVGAAAGIVAKTVRDALMRRLATRYPGYGWDTNVGYATEEHRSAIVELGVTPHHRLSFQPTQLGLDLFGQRCNPCRTRFVREGQGGGGRHAAPGAGARSPRGWPTKVGVDG